MPNQSTSKFLINQTKDDQTRLEVRLEDESGMTSPKIDDSVVSKRCAYH